MKKYFCGFILVGLLTSVWSNTFDGESADQSRGWADDIKEETSNNPFDLWEFLFDDAGPVQNLGKQMSDSLKEDDWKQ